MLILQKLVLNTSLINFHRLLIALLFLINIDIESALVASDEVNHIDVCAIDILEYALLRVNSNTHCLVDADSLNSVTWLHKVDEILIHTEVNSVRGFTLWD